MNSLVNSLARLTEVGMIIRPEVNLSKRLTAIRTALRSRHAGVLQKRRTEDLLVAELILQYLGQAVFVVPSGRMDGLKLASFSR